MADGSLSQEDIDALLGGGSLGGGDFGGGGGDNSDDPLAGSANRIVGNKKATKIKNPLHLKTLARFINRTDC